MHQRYLGHMLEYLQKTLQGTAYTLSFALAALAIYQKEQEILFDEVTKVLKNPNGQIPVRTMCYVLLNLP